MKSSVRELPRRLARVALGVGLAFTGTAHFRSADSFRAQVPPWLPAPDAIIAISGVMEWALALGLLFLVRYRVQMGWATAAFFVAIFPGNLSQFFTHTAAFGLDTDRSRFIRLLFQPMLVVWALWCTGAWRQRRW